MRLKMKHRNFTWLGIGASVLAVMLLVMRHPSQEAGAMDSTACIVSVANTAAALKRGNGEAEKQSSMRAGQEGGAVKMTAAMVAALPAPEIVLEQDPEAAAAVAAELARVNAILKKRSEESIRGQEIGVGKALRFRAQSDRELAALVSGMRMPAAISGEQVESVRMMAMAQLAKEYGVARTVTPQLKMNFSSRGGEARTSFVNFQETGGEGPEPVQWCPFLHGGAEAPPWKYDFLVTPELAALDALATGKYLQRVMAGEDNKAVERAVCEELTTPEGSR